jgi:hypothetical protein
MYSKLSKGFVRVHCIRPCPDCVQKHKMQTALLVYVELAETVYIRRILDEIPVRKPYI